MSAALGAEPLLARVPLVVEALFELLALLVLRELFVVREPLEELGLFVVRELFAPPERAPPELDDFARPPFLRSSAIPKKR
jgi:hypothetical protein